MRCLPDPLFSPARGPRKSTANVPESHPNGKSSGNVANSDKARAETDESVEAVDGQNPADETVDTAPGADTDTSVDSSGTESEAEGSVKVAEEARPEAEESTESPNEQVAAEHKSGSGRAPTYGGFEMQAPASEDARAGDPVTMTSTGVDQSPPSSGGRPKKAMRRAHLALSRIEPWSMMKFSFIVSLVCFIILLVAVAVVYVILQSLGVFDAVTELITSLTDGGEPGDEMLLNPAAWFSPARVFGFTVLVGALNVILITALATVGAMLYNLAADLVGGLDITLSESE